MYSPRKFIASITKKKKQESCRDILELVINPLLRLALNLSHTFLYPRLLIETVHEECSFSTEKVAVRGNDFTVYPKD